MKGVPFIVLVAAAGFLAYAYIVSQKEPPPGVLETLGNAAESAGTWGKAEGNLLGDATGKMVDIPASPVTAVIGGGGTGFGTAIKRAELS